jgi:protein-tyrosine phosphatase
MSDSPGTDVLPAAVPEIPGVTNLRDAGGHRTTDGRRVRAGVLFRSGQLAHDGADSMAAIEGLGLGVVFDLRTEVEREALPDRVPNGVEVQHLDVLAGATSSVATHLEDIFSDPVAAETVLRSGDIEQHYVSTYRDLVTLESARESYQQLFSQLASRDVVALFHCTAGKDRTGWAAASLLTLLGVDDDVVTQDYLLSSAPVVASFQPYIDQFAAAGGNPDLLVPVFCVEPAYLDAARDQVNIVFGSIEGYFRDGLGLDADVVDALRARLLSDD